MKIYVVTSGVGGVVAAGPDEAAVRAEVEEEFSGRSTETEWRKEWGGQERLYYRGHTGRWSSIPARFIQTVEVDLCRASNKKPEEL